jgi:1-acyl-sn-glycerol-3-phosphate acyltransferase
MFLRVIVVYLTSLLIIIINYILFHIINAGRHIGLYDKDKSIEYCCKIYYFTLYYLKKIWFWIKIDYKNMSNSNKISGQNIIVCNHISYFDPFVLAYINYQYADKYWKIRFVAYHKAFQIPLLGYIIKSLGTIPIEMESTSIEMENKYKPGSSKKLMEKCEKILSSGYSIFIFPEGKRNSNPSHLNKLKLGAYNLSKKTGCKLQVLSLNGIDKIWPAKGQPSGSGTITVTKCGDPIFFDNPEQYREQVSKLIRMGLQHNDK